MPAPCFGVEIPAVVYKKPGKFTLFVPLNQVVEVMCILNKLLKYYIEGKSVMEEIVFEAQVAQ